MSKILKETGYRELSHIVECKGKKYFVDSNNTFDGGYETMVFNTIGEDEEVDWEDLYAEWYDSYEEMKQKHYEICNNLENYIDNEEE